MRRHVLLAAAVMAAVTAVPAVTYAQGRNDPEAQARKQEEEAAKRRKRQEEWGDNQAPLPQLRNAGPCPFVKTLYDAARYMGWAPISLGPIQFVLPTAQWLGAIMSAIVAVIWFVVAKWIYDLNPSGWMFVVIMAIIYLVLQFLAILGSTSWQSVMWGVLVCVLTLILAFLPGTKRAFGQ